MIKKILISATAFCLLPLFSQGNETEISPAHPLAHISSNPGFCSIFHEWGFIGDSLCSGEHEYHKPDGSKGYHDMYDYSWGQRICAHTGTKGDNYSQGGETARGWISHFWDKPYNRNNNIDAKLDPKQAYIMALGVNDSNNPKSHPCGDVQKDICKEDFRKNADTFAGNYAGIIQRIRTIAPDSRFFLVTMPKKTEYNDVIRAMADIFSNTYIIDLEKYGPSYAKGSMMREKYYLGNHLNAMGYEYTAWMFMTYINWIIEHNWKDFEQVAFIGTPYNY